MTNLQRRTLVRIASTVALSGVAWCAQASRPASASPSAEPILSLLARKLANGHVLLMRHATAPGVSDPAGFKLGDCSTQRNLSAQGHQEAAHTGAWLKSQGVTQAEVFSSAWCRCQDTARGLGYGPHQVTPALASFFEDPSQAPSTTAALQTLVASYFRQPRKALILVTHNVNIQAYAGAHVASGELVLARVDMRGRVLSFEPLLVPNAF